ncbi:hypothetical protein D3C86_1967900 [compost metagenome]
MVGVDFQAHAIKLAGIDAQVTGHGTDGFGQYHRGAAVQQAVGLVSAVVDDHAGGQGHFIEVFEADIQHFADGVFLDRVQLIDVGSGTPQTHC